MIAVAADRFATEIESYWDGRSHSYSNGVTGELADDRGRSWQQVVDRITREPFATARAEGRTPRALDLGCGPGFFSVLFGKMGCEVDAVDMSAQMIARAQENVDMEGVASAIRFHQGDICKLPFEDNTFDLAISRNVTWLLREPESTYAEWLRVLRPNGKLAAFDANWYRYLADPNVAAARRADMDRYTLDVLDEDAKATSDEEKRCEAIALKLPMTYEMRPAWDLKTLSSFGARASADEDIWREVWTENEQCYYASSPMFLVEAVK